MYLEYLQEQAHKALKEAHVAEMVYTMFNLEAHYCERKEETLRLVIGEIASMIEVFKGVTESISDGKGLFHRTREANIVFRMEHRIEPCPGYRISVSRRLVESEELREAAIILTPTEAFAVALALESSMSRIAFGD